MDRKLTTSFVIRLPRRLLDELRQRAIERNISANQLANSLLRAGLSSEKSEKPKPPQELETDVIGLASYALIRAFAKNPQQVDKVISAIEHQIEKKHLNGKTIFEKFNIK